MKRMIARSIAFFLASGSAALQHQNGIMIRTTGVSIRRLGCGTTLMVGRVTPSRHKISTTSMNALKSSHNMNDDRRREFRSHNCYHDSNRSVHQRIESRLHSTTSEDTLTSKPPTKPQKAKFVQINEEQIQLPDGRIVNIRRKKPKRKKKPRSDKRHEFIGLAKAVDRGQFTTVYQPAKDGDGKFLAKSGLPDRSKPFTVLGIESSCDDTGAAIVRSDGIILGESLASQNHIHEEWGGVVPGLARTAHEEKIDVVIDEALAQAGMSMDEVDAVGVTVGPGLEICLRVGCERAKELAIQYEKPFVAIHHLEAHILMARLPPPLVDEDHGESRTAVYPSSDGVHESRRAIEFPFLALLVSGGHCQILKCQGIGQYTILGGTIDDSLGEAFDKTARLLSLPVGGGGGPAVEKLALEGDPKAISLTVPMQNRKDCDFSFSGLKTNIRRATVQLKEELGLSEEEELSREDKADIAASFQNVAIKHIEQRLNRVMTYLETEELENNDTTNHPKIRSLAVVGGVAANTELRTRLQTLCGKRSDPWTMHVPPPRLCTDQGSMSAWAAIERIMVGSSDLPHHQEVHARFPFAEQ
mmetsp:Transcript_2713/g.3155  ORF Transcript_2713/g.3155 Transcript_2713/m.3155 type:complete len:585 (+) Transcript_2713:117-1871(+)